MENHKWVPHWTLCWCYNRLVRSANKPPSTCRRRCLDSAVSPRSDLQRWLQVHPAPPCECRWWTRPVDPRYPLIGHCQRRALDQLRLRANSVIGKASGWGLFHRKWCSANNRPVPWEWSRPRNRGDRRRQLVGCAPWRGSPWDWWYWRRSPLRCPPLPSLWIAADCWWAQLHHRLSLIICPFLSRQFDSHFFLLTFNFNSL